MPEDITIQDHEHGTWRGLAAHTRKAERYCLACATFSADRNRARRINVGERRSVQISALAVARILRGWDPIEALADEIGPLTLAALRGYRAGDDRG